MVSGTKKRKRERKREGERERTRNVRKKHCKHGDQGIDRRDKIELRENGKKGLYKKETREMLKAFSITSNRTKMGKKKTVWLRV